MARIYSKPGPENNKQVHPVKEAKTETSRPEKGNKKPEESEKGGE